MSIASGNSRSDSDSGNLVALRAVIAGIGQVHRPETQLGNLNPIIQGDHRNRSHHLLPFEGVTPAKEWLACVPRHAQSDRCHAGCLPGSHKTHFTAPGSAQEVLGNRGTSSDRLLAELCRG